ncbi:putative RND superfamily exporter protein [Natranaerovirga hydrolytica]|uniref:Putative RND superfamily exporter protein n=1 Tax=Natranaerovirga hydrolytica TaxID=680378 RepID=A0A4R1MKS0_9FIRM|nr:MMPL family transporter [Natranaerovirga hydrolytica]TCK93336.1 putative RND superfamily exporter protein [Natranaerovirga hydrolytica]
MHLFAEKIIKHYKIILVISLMLFIVSAFGASRLNISSDMEEMLPSDSQTVQSNREFDQYFDSQETGIVVVKGPSKESKDFLADLETELINRDVQAQVLYQFDLSEVEDFALLYLDREDFEAMEEAIESQDIESISGIMTSIKEGVESQEDLVTYITNEDEDAFIMMIRPSIDRSDFLEGREIFYDDVIGSIESLLSQDRYELLEAGLTGGAFIQDIEADRIAFDGFFETIIITILLIIIIIVISFRRTLLLTSVMYPLILGMLLAAAIAYVLYGSINMFSMSFALLLIGLGIDFAIHLISRYLEERDKGKAVDEAVSISFQKTGVSIITGALTTSAAFLAFVLAKFKAFEQMGIISSIGIIALCMTMIIIIPALIMGIDFKRKEKTTKKKVNFTFLNTIGDVIEKKPLVFIGMILLMIPILFVNVKNTEIVGDMNEIYPDNIESKQWEKVLIEEFNYSPNTLTFMVDDKETLITTLEAFEEREDIEEVLSIYEYLPTDQDYKLEVIGQLQSFLQSIGYSDIEELEVERITMDDLPENLKANYIGREGKLLVEAIPSVNLYDEEKYAIIEKAILEVSGNTPVSMAAIMNEVVTLVKQDVFMISTICLLIIAGFLLLVFKSLKDMLICVTPVMLTLYITLGLLPVLNKEINVFSILGFPLLIGIGIDSSIHLLHRLKSEETGRIGYVLMTTGKAIILTGITTLIGFGSLTFINHPGMANLGFTVALGLIICLLITLTFIPAVFVTLHSKKK